MLPMLYFCEVKTILFRPPPPPPLPAPAFEALDFITVESSNSGNHLRLISKMITLL